MDIYSFGVVLWEIVTQDKGRRGQLRQTKVPEECPAEIEALIDQYVHLQMAAAVIAEWHCPSVQDFDSCYCRVALAVFVRQFNAVCFAPNNANIETSQDTLICFSEYLQ